MKIRATWGLVVTLAAFVVPSTLGAAPADRPRSVAAKGSNDLLDMWYGRTPLMRAALKGDAATVKALLAQGADINARDKNGMTALMWAAPEVAPLLLANGADTRAVDHFGRSSLSYAAFLGDEARVTALLDAGIAVNGPDQAGWTPLFFALAGATQGSPRLHLWHNWVLADLGDVRSKEADAYRQVIRLLLRRGANVEARDGLGHTPLLFLLHSFTYQPRWGGRLLIDELLEHGANVSAVSVPNDYDGRTPLMWAALKGDTTSVEALLDYGAAVNARDKNGMTALMWAAPEVAPLLLARGADPHVRDKFGRTPLSYAAYQGDAPRVKTLLSRGLKVDDKDLDGLTPLFFALYGQCGYYRTGSWPKKEQVLTSLRKVRQREAGELLLQLLLDQVANVNARDNKGRTPLIFYAQNQMFPGNPQPIVYLLGKGVDVNAADADGHTALMWRAFWGDAQAVELLLKRGADPLARNRMGETALSMVSRWPKWGDEAQVQALLTAAPDTSEPTKALPRTGSGR
jgi:ankyrin repeat protein